MGDLLKKLVVSLAESADESFEKGKNNLSGGLKKMLGRKEDVQFSSTTDVLNYMLSEVSRGYCQHHKLSAADDFSVILKWIKQNLKGDRYYMVRGFFNDGSIAIAVFFADEDRVYAERHDPKICYTCDVLPKDISDLFGNKNIYVQSFSK
ncbi:hypothetical protein [Bacteroides togonis]|uniref:hypothetical protein n=1 Tax=Bacteroides togonis TaxID=1917883 RepID=UPI00094B5E4C|nr:hypothetical protein [Bacteroides togonis]